MENGIKPPEDDKSLDEIIDQLRSQDDEWEAETRKLRELLEEKP